MLLLNVLIVYMQCSVFISCVQCMYYMCVKARDLRPHRRSCWRIHRPALETARPRTDPAFNTYLYIYAYTSTHNHKKNIKTEGLLQPASTYSHSLLLYINIYTYIHTYLRLWDMTVGRSAAGTGNARWCPGHHSAVRGDRLIHTYIHTYVNRKNEMVVYKHVIYFKIC